MRPLTFYRQVLITAFKHPFGVADAISTTLGILIPLFGKLNPAWGAAMTDLGWQIPLAGFSALFLYRLVLAPYWMYQERDNAVIALEMQLQTITDGTDARRREYLIERLRELLREWGELGPTEGLEVSHENYGHFARIKSLHSRIKLFVEEHWGEAASAQYQKRGIIVLEELLSKLVGEHYAPMVKRN